MGRSRRGRGSRALVLAAALEASLVGALRFSPCPGDLHLLEELSSPLDSSVFEHGVQVHHCLVMKRGVGLVVGGPQFVDERPATKASRPASMWGRPTP